MRVHGEGDGLDDLGAPRVHPLAGQPAPPELLVNVTKLVAAYYAERPDPSVSAQRVAFGTSGHRGSSLDAGFNEAHVLAITQAICLYERMDFAATPEQKAALAGLSPSDIRLTALAGDPIQTVLTTTPGGHRPIGGIKVVTERGWFAARPSGTEAVCKLYAESFEGRDHLRRIQEDAHAIIQKAFTTDARG